MGRARLRFGSAAMLVAVAACVSGRVAAADPAPRAPRVVAGSGTSGGGVFTAGSSGALFELPSRARLRVAPHAALRVFPVPQALELAPGPRTTTWSLALLSGRVDVEMPSLGHTAVLASLGKLSAIVTGGRVALLVRNDEASVANVEGDVKTLLSDHWQTVAVGAVATLSRDNPSASAKPGLPFPTLNGGQRMFFAPSEAARMTGFRWAPVPGAASYELRLRRLADGQVVDQRGTAETEFSDGFKPVEPGKYSLNLRSLDARGLESNWGPDAELRVIGVVLPPGGYSSDKTIFLGPGQRVEFTNTSGLEMTYLGAGRYFPATHGVTLYRDTTTVVGFRLPGALDTATARLEPRGVYADVSIGPKRALWPHDAVSIDIQLKAKSGGAIPAFLQLVPKVMLGLEPLEVSFERSGTGLHAIVPPSAKPGPWVLRVDVADQFGVPLGHDFLEIAAEPRRKPPAVQIVSAAQSAKKSAAKQISGAKVASSD